MLNRFSELSDSQATQFMAIAESVKESDMSVDDQQKLAEIIKNPEKRKKLAKIGEESNSSDSIFFSKEKIPE